MTSLQVTEMVELAGVNCFGQKGIQTTEADRFTANNDKSQQAIDMGKKHDPI